MTFEGILTEGARALGLELPRGALERFRIYDAYLAEQNALMNLTAIGCGHDTARLHFLDSMALFGAAEIGGASVIDVGAGAGFPGAVLKLVRRDIRLTMLDGQQKRVDFLRRLCALLELEDVKCLHMRAELAPHELRESFGFAVSRAVAELRVLTELSLPFVSVGGAMLAMKGPEPEAELGMALGAIAKLGGRYERTITYTVPGTDIRHSIIVVRKLEKTPEKYPRRFAKIQNNPL